MLDDDRRSYVHQSLKQFGIDTERPLGHLAHYYVEVPVVWARNSWTSEPGKLIATPFDLLVPSTSDTVYPLSTPYIAMVVGPSGVGKTEFIRQLCRVCAGAPAESSKSLPLRVLPIRLADCAEHLVSQDRKPSPERFRQALFSRLALLDDSLIKEIAEGSLLLALDGLDEVIRHRAQHDVFFECLHEMLAPYQHAGRHRIRVVITCRLEYLNALEVSGATEIQPDFSRKREECQEVEVTPENGMAHSGDRRNRDAARLAEQMGIHFLRIDFFQPARIETYLSSRGLERLRRYVKTEGHPMREVMQRPLFLKLLCDTASKEPGARPPEIQNVTEVLEFLVERALKSADSVWVWDNDDLARCAFELFKVRRTWFESAAKVAPAIRKKGHPGMMEHAPPDIFEAVHKCPFLQRENSGLRFTHQVFFQYFVARGMYLSVKESGSRQEPGLADFDRFILTVEMRQFLHDMMGGQTWEERTKKSFALDSESIDTWPKPEWCREKYETLDRLRAELLRYLIDVGRNPTDGDQPKQVKDVVREFLALDSSLLHPRFLLSCHEAVAVYVIEHRWGEQDIDSSFETRIRKDLEFAVRALKRGQKQGSADDLGCLVLRILDIGYRLRFPTVMRWVNREKQLRFITGDTGEQLMRLREQVQAVAPPKRMNNR